MHLLFQPADVKPFLVEGVGGTLEEEGVLYLLLV